MRPSRALLLAVGSACALAVENEGFRNCDFEQGTTGWSVWYSDDPKKPMARYPWEADPAVAHGGKQSLKIVAPDQDGCAFVHRSSDAIAPGARYAISYWFRRSPGLDPKTFCVRLNCRPANAAKSKWKMKGLQPTIMSRRTEGEWEYRGGYVRMPKDAKPLGQLGLYLRNARGTIWIDDVQVREVKPDENVIADLWTYDPHRVELGSAPLKKFIAFKEANDPVLARAARYNEALVKSAFVKEDLRRLKRIIGYGAGDSPRTAGQLASRMENAEQALAGLYRAYGEPYVDRKSREKAARFDRLARELQTELEALQKAIKSRISAAIERRRTAGARWSPPPAPLNPGRPAITGDGRVNQIIYGKRSLWHFQELEKPLGFDPVHSTTVGNPASTAPGEYDWSVYDKQWDDIRASGIPKQSCLLLFMALHDGCYAPAWLRAKAKTDPEILQVTRPPATLRSRGSRAQLNWWHPEARRYAREIVNDMGRAFRSRDEFLFYEFQWESAGPYVSTNSGVREMGYGRYAEQDFRRWLRSKYGNVARLNARWQTAYQSFDAIAPPPDKFVEQRRHTGPLAAEWEAWREESYRDWCRLIYRAWKESDPSKPVLAGHSGLFRRFSDADAYDTCDMLGFHCGGLDFMPATLYINSISRYNGHKPLAQYENFWGIQEHHDRMHEELPKRHCAQKHVFRLTVWNRFLQIWWYAYTSATYLTHYDGNFFDPSYALTTLRYRTAGLPVYFRKFKRLQRALLNSHIVPSRICVLAPTASMRNNFPYWATQTETRELFWQLFPRNYLFELVPEEYMLDGRAKLDDFDVLVLPYAPYLSESLQGAISRWLETGTRLLLSCGPFGVHDEIGLDSRKLFNEAFGGVELRFESPASQRWQWAAEPSPPGDMLKARLGDSELIVLLRTMADLKFKPDVIDYVIDRIERATDRTAYDDGNVFEMVLREQDDTRYLCVLNPSLDDAAESTVHVKGSFRAVTDLDYEQGFPIPAKRAADTTAFPLRLEPGEATIIRLGPT